MKRSEWRDKEVTRILAEVLDDLIDQGEEITEEQLEELYVLFFRHAAIFMEHPSGPIINIPRFGRFMPKITGFEDELRKLENIHATGRWGDMSERISICKQTIERLRDEKWKRKRKYRTDNTYDETSYEW